jgi:hypothetical protein
MEKNQTKKYYWGIGIENETYLQFEDSRIVSGAFIQEKIGCERYSIDYRKCYKAGSIDSVLSQAFHENEQYQVSQMVNSHTLDKLDKNYGHKTLTTKITPTENQDNPDYLGKSIIELFLENQPYNIQSMVTQKTNPMGSVNFDGDSIEFITKYFENRTIDESCQELKATKDLFISKLNESEIIQGNLKFPAYNIGLNMFMSNQENLVLFNNGTYHFHITLPTLTENSRIVDYQNFDKIHSKAIYLLQWFEPFFIATLGSPDIMGVISTKHKLDKTFALGSMRNAMSRYTGVGTFHKSMARGKILTYNVDDFRQLIRFKKEDQIWWRDKIESEMEYELLSDIGLDFNQEKMYQSGFEFRSFDEFPISYLSDVLSSILLISEHSLALENVAWGHDSIVWNNLVFKSLKHGYLTEVTSEEKDEVLDVLQLLKITDLNLTTLQAEFEAIEKLDEFFFKILSVIHEKYKNKNTCLDSMHGQKPSSPPIWENFNKYQIEKHLEQLEKLIEY